MNMGIEHRLERTHQAQIPLRDQLIFTQALLNTLFFLIQQGLVLCKAL